MIIFFNILFIVINIFNTPVNGAVHYTPYVDLCDYATARNVSQPITNLFKKNQVHAGFFTVDKKFNMNLYSVYVKSVNSSEETPLIVWIQGQPGISSLYAIFGQHGPYCLDEDNKFEERWYAWTNHYDVLYLDNMIFTGYSYSDDPTNIVLYLKEIGRYLYEALFQFYQIFPEATAKRLFLAGEFFAAKYLLLLGHHIHTRNPLSHVKMSLHGIYIGSGFTDPVNMMQYAAFFYQIGIIDYDKMKDIDILQRTIVKSIHSKRYDTARQQFGTIWLEVANVGYKTPMDFTKLDYDLNRNISTFLQSDKFQKAFDLFEMNYYKFNDTDVFLESRNVTVPILYLVEEDAFQSVVHVLPLLLNHYRVLFYGAQFDLLVPYVHISNFIRRLEWKGAIDYYDMVKYPRKQWFVQGEMAGYWKTIRNLTEVMVRNAGHMIDASQPKWAINLLTSFISNKFKPPSIPVQKNAPSVQLKNFKTEIKP